MESQSDKHKIQISLSQLRDDYMRMPAVVQDEIAKTCDPIERSCFVHGIPKPVANVIMELYQYDCQSESFLNLLNYFGITSRGHSGECPHQKDHLAWQLKNKYTCVCYNKIVLKCRTCLNDYLIDKNEFLSKIDQMTKIYHSHEIDCDSPVHTFELHLGTWGEYYCSVVCKKCQKCFEIKKCNFDSNLCFEIE